MGNYTLGDAARILKVSPGRLRYWERTALVRLRNELQESEESAPSFEFRDLVCARAVLGLIEQGVSLRRIRNSVERLRHNVPELEDPLSALRVWAEGSPRVVVQHAGRLLEPSGQMVLDFVAGPEGEAPPVADLTLHRETETAPPSAIDWFERGCSFDADAKTYGEAEEAYRHAIEIDPTFADAHCNLGAVLYNQGQRSAARRCFERCIELEARHVEGHYNLGNLLEEDGADKPALHHYQSALEGDPLSAELHVNLALLHEKMGAPLLGREHWRRYLQIEPKGPWSDVARQRVKNASPRR